METVAGVSWKSLPPAGRKAVQAYGVRGLPRKLQWGYTEVPLWWLVREVLEHNRAQRTFPSMDALVAANQICTPTYSWMKSRPNSIWAIILEGPPGGPYIAGSVIEDGWHRFGWYLCHHHPETMIPVIWGVH